MDEATQEVIVASTSNEHSIGVWDVSTGTLLTSFKGNACGRNALSLLGKDYLMAAQSGKGSALHFWTWKKDQVHQRSFMSQQIGSVACSPDGVYCAAGSVKGTIFIWETGSGKLLRYWSAHYKAVNDLAFSRDGSFLVSGGGDAGVSVWLMMDVLALERITTLSTPRSLATWSSHTLPVTSVYIGAASGDTIILSVSLDRSCKIWSLESQKLLKSYNLPSSLHSLALDRWEGSVFLGGGEGRIYQAHLDGHSAQAEPKDNSIFVSSKSQGLQEAGIDVFVGHTRCVNSLATTSDSFSLISGSEDETIKVWDIQSRQVLRSIAAKGPVTNVIIMTQVIQSAASASNSGKKASTRTEPLGVFGKQVEIASNSYSTEENWTPPPIILDGCQGYRGIVQETGLLKASREQHDEVEASAQVDVAQGTDSELAALQAQLDSAKKLILDLRATNSKLHAFVMQSAGKQSC